MDRKPQTDENRELDAIQCEVNRAAPVAACFVQTAESR